MHTHTHNFGTHRVRAQPYKLTIYILKRIRLHYCVTSKLFNNNIIQHTARYGNGIGHSYKKKDIVALVGIQGSHKLSTVLSPYPSLFHLFKIKMFTHKRDGMRERARIKKMAERKREQEIRKKSMKYMLHFK